MSRAAPLLPSVTVAQAVQCVRQHVASLPPLPAEALDLGAVLGRILAEPLAASWPMPPADVSVMDGWSVRSADVHAALGHPGPIVLEASEPSAAGHPPDRPLVAGHAGRIFTGAVLPQGADAVVPQEDVEVTPHDGGVRITIDRAAAQTTTAGRFVRARGSEVGEGDVLATPGTRLGTGEIAVLASAGHAGVCVHRRPRVAILCTGDELIRLGQRPGPGQIVSSNGLMLAGQVTEAGGEPIILPNVGDDRAALRAALNQGLSADILLTSGGISVGDHDLVRAELEALGVQIQVHGLALRPGKPTAFGTRADTMVFALPGNPGSAWVAFVLLVLPALLARTGDASPRLPLRLSMPITARITGAGNRAHYVRARWAPDGSLAAVPLPAQASGNLRSIGGVDLLLVVPIGVEAIEAGASCQALVLRPAPEPAA